MPLANALSRAFKDKDEPDLVDEINRLGAEVKQIEGELAKARRQARIDEHADHKLFIIRWREAIAKIESPDPDERLLARATVAQEFRRVIDAIVLHDDRHISVRVKKGQCDGSPTRIRRQPRYRRASAAYSRGRADHASHQSTAQNDTWP